MNRVIKDLAEQAGFQYIKDSGIGWAGNYNASLPKFAELLIQKCADIGERYADGNYEVRNQILEHFGVEE